jgi:hypothetical protein
LDWEGRTRRALLVTIRLEARMALKGFIVGVAQVTSEVVMHDKVVCMPDVGGACSQVNLENQDPGIRFTCSTTSCVEMHFDSFTCFRDLLEA